MSAVTQDYKGDAKKLKAKAKASLALLLVALISISTATYAWFTLANSTSVQSMIIEVGTGTTLKAYAGTTASTNVGDYFAVIKSEGTNESYKNGEIVTDALPGTTGGVEVNSLGKIKLWPVTSGDGVKLYTQGGNASAAANPQAGPEKMYYVELTFTFISDTTMDVYLNGDNSATNVEDRTQVLPSTDGSRVDEDAVRAMRMSFEADGSAVIYEPGSDGTDTALTGHARADSGQSTQQTFSALGTNAGRGKGTANESPVLFTLEKDKPKVVVIRMWVEGEDKECVNTNTINIEKGKMDVRLRFCGADKDGNFIETAPR